MQRGTPPDSRAAGRSARVPLALLLPALLLPALVDVGPVHAEHRVVVNRWTVEDGLPQTSVTAIARDRHGFLWLATFGGVARFDGRTFTRIDPPSAGLDGHRFTAIAAIGDEIWVGTGRGRLFRLADDGDAPPVEVPLDRATDDALWQILPVGDRLLVAASRNGVFEVRDGRARAIGPRIDTYLLTVGEDGTVWAAGLDGVRCVETTCPDMPIESPVAMTTLGGGLRVSTATAGWRREGTALVPDPTARLTSLSQVLREGWNLAQVGRLELQVDEGRPLTLSSLHSALVVGPDQAWFGSNTEGLVRIRVPAPASFPLPSPQGEAAALALPMADGSVLAAGYCNGLFRMAPAPHGDLHPTVLFATRSCVDILAPDPTGGAWMDAYQYGEGPRLWHIAPGGEPRPVAVAPDLAAPGKALVDDGQGLWLGSLDGLARLVRSGDGFRVERRWGVADGLPDAKVFALTLDDTHGLLVGTAKGAVRLVGDRLEPLGGAAARDTIVRDILVRGDVAWLATYGDGVARVELTGPRAGETRWLDGATGFCSDNVSRIVDAAGHAWFNTNEGVMVVSWSELEAAALYGSRLACDRHDTGEGNGGGGFAGGIMADGRLVFPTQSGLAVLPPTPPVRPPVPGTFIEAAAVDGLTLTPAGRTVVPPGRRDLHLQLASPLFDLGPGEATRFETVLVRDGRELVREVTGPSANFVGLPPGTYTLRVRRVTARGLGPGATLRFRLARAWSETTAARIGIPAALLALAGLVLWSWVRTLRARARALEAELAEHARAEAARRERDTLYNTVFEHAPGPLVLLTRDGLIEELNPAARVLLGGPVPGQALTDSLATDEERLRGRALLAEAARAPARDELLVQASDGSARRVQMYAGAVDLDGKPYLLVAAHDVTAERDAEARRAALQSQAAARERLEAIGRLAGGVAHDVNNVLAVFQALIDEARGQVTEPARMRSTLAELQAAVRAGRDVTTRFLGFGKDAGTPTPLALDEAVPASRRLLERLLAPEARLVLDCHSAGAWVQIVPGHLDRLLLNLVVNASDALGGEGGEIRIVARAVSAAPTEGTTIIPAPPGPLVALSVEDTGCGMDEDTRRRAFEPFFSTKDTKGTGLGLQVVYNVVTAAGGGLVVVSEPGRGSRFTVLLPRVAAPAAVAPRGGGHSVLVCDDNPLVRTGTGRLFRGAGWRVVEAEDGAAALARLADHPTDLVVTDQDMPHVDGVGLVSALRRQARATPVILISGDPLDASNRLSQEVVDNVRVVGKPFPAAELLALAADLVAPTEPPAAE